MVNLYDKFIFWYFNEFQTDQLYLDMVKTIEDSPWHRERNVGTHTDMVVSHYMDNVSSEIWDEEVLCGALACVFHDVGKPEAEEVLFSEKRGIYRRYAGHEKTSARLWEDYATTNWPMFIEKFGLEPTDMYRVGFLIEKHLPFGLKNIQKKRNLALTILELFPEQNVKVFNAVLLADAFGRIADDVEQKRSKVVEWILEFGNFVSETKEWKLENPKPDITQKTLYIPIAASGSGKTSFVRDMEKRSGVVQGREFHIYSWDELRLRWYIDQDDCSCYSESKCYEMAFNRQIKDKEFNKKAQQEFMTLIRNNVDIFVDNTNTSTKSRAFFVSTARQHGYRIVGILFPISLNKLYHRMAYREDKRVPTKSVYRHYMNIALPQYGEFDDVWIFNDNLDVVE